MSSKSQIPKDLRLRRSNPKSSLAPKENSVRIVGDDVEMMTGARKILEKVYIQVCMRVTGANISRMDRGKSREVVLQGTR